jgi:N-acetylmuramoyl-L-alanine amidase
MKKIKSTIIAIVLTSFIGTSVIGETTTWEEYIIPEHVSVNIEELADDLETFVSEQIGTERVQCLARNIYYESRGEPIDGQMWVAWVTINRRNHDRYPETICSVVHQCNRNNVCQFSWVRSNRHATPREHEAWNLAVRLAVSVLVEEQFAENPDPTNGAIMFHADYVSPRWRHSYEVVDQIGSHIFYR